MNFKTTYILFGLLALMLVTLGVVVYYNDGPAGANEKYVFPSFHKKDKSLRPDDVVKVTIERLKPDAGTLVFEKDGKDWRMTSPRAMPADDARVSELVNALAEATLDEGATVPAAKDAGVDDPSRRITLHTKDRELKLTVGHVSLAGELGVAYVRSSDLGQKVAAVKRDRLGPALEGINYFRQKDLLGGESSDLQGISVARGDRKVVLSKDKDRWRMTDPPYGEANISDLLSSLGRVSVSHVSDKDSDFVADGVTDLKKYGLDGKDVLRIEVTRGRDKAAKTTTLLVSDKKSDDKKGDDKKDGDKVFATLAPPGGKGPYDIVKLPASAVEPFTKILNDPDSLRGKALVDLPTGTEPDAIDIEEHGNKLEFRRDGTQWRLYRGGDTSVKVDEAEVRKLITELTSRSAITSFVDPKMDKPRETLGVDRPDVVTVRIYADSLDRPDPKKPAKPTPKADKLAATIKLGLKRDGRVGVERLWGKDSTLAYVSPALEDLVRRGALAYMEKSIEPFNLARTDENVTKIELKRDGETFVLTRADDKSPWLFEQPAALKGKPASETAVNSLLAAFNRPMVVAIEKEKATPAELQAYGLNTPPVVFTVTLTKDKKPVSHTYSLGKEVGQGPTAGVALKLGGSDMVYVVNRVLLTDAKQDLRDPTIFSFKPDDAVALKVTVWNPTEGAAATATFEKKAGQWVRAGVADFKVNQDRVKELLGELSSLKAEKFVPSGKGMEVKDGALKLEVTTADKKTYEVTVGAQEGGSFYASSPQQPGTAFLISQAKFPDLKKGFTYLRQ